MIFGGGGWLQSYLLGALTGCEVALLFSFKGQVKSYASPQLGTATHTSIYSTTRTMLTNNAPARHDTQRDT
jgi:hypothetical protein